MYEKLPLLLSIHDNSNTQYKLGVSPPKEGPHQWWFNSSSLFTKYFYYDAQSARTFSKNLLTVDLRTGKVMTTGQNPTKLMHLVSLFDDNYTWHLITIEPLGLRSGNQIYGMNEYTLMSQQELDKYQTEYAFDWDEYRSSKK